MKLNIVEVDGKTYAEVQDGKPVYTDDAGKTVAFDAPGTAATITRLNAEAKSHRTRAEAAEGSLKAFEGIEDPAAALKALATMKGLDAKALIDAGKADEMRAAAIKAVEDKYAPVLAERDGLQGQLRQERIGGSFARSKYIAEKLAVPVDFVEARFGGNFSLEDGKMVAKDSTGNPIYSKARPGEIAGFDEAMEILVDAYPHRDSILKGTGSQGGGARPGNPGGTGAKTMSRAQYDAMAPKDRTAKMRDGLANKSGNSFSNLAPNFQRG